jgi:hypothetical protein
VAMVGTHHSTFRIQDDGGRQSGFRAPRTICRNQLSPPKIRPKASGRKMATWATVFARTASATGRCSAV